MTNKQYKQVKEEHENNDALFTYEHYNGFSWYPSRYMTTDDMRELRAEQKTDIAKYNGVKIDARAVVLKYDCDCVLLKSYKTIVAAIVGTQFIKLWDGFSVTTLKHINQFLSAYNGATVNKRAWIEMDTATGEIISNTTGQIFTARELRNA